MKHTFLSVTLFLATAVCSYAQTNKSILLNGFYIAKTGNVAAAKLDIITYLRFYKDSSVYLQTVNTFDPQAVAVWFGRYKKFSQKGTYHVNGSSILIQLNNKDSKDFQLEGLQETVFKGSLTSDNKLCLKMDNETKENCFGFSKVLDTTHLKYTSFKPDIKLPGDWKVKQVLQGSKQVFFTNEDSSIVAVSIFTAARLPVYKATQSDFESAYAYYEWDSQYMKDDQKMEVKKITENKDKAFVIWNAKDANNDNYHLFARHKELLYNVMVYDNLMPLDKKLALLEMLYDLNKD